MPTPSRRHPRFVPMRPVHSPEEWGAVLVREMSDVRTIGPDRISDAILAAVAALDEAVERNGPEPACVVRTPGEARLDAVGYWRPRASERIVHRFAGLSKALPPPDPFRTGSRTDAAIRCESGVTHGRPNPNPVSCQAVHHHDGGTTSVTITTGPGETPFAPWHEHSADRIRILLLNAASAIGRAATTPEANRDFLADAMAQAVHLLPEGDHDPAVASGSLSITAPSPVHGSSASCTWSRRDRRADGTLPRLLAIPTYTYAYVSRTGDGLGIHIGCARERIAVRDIDPMTRLRAHARIVERGYGEIEA